MPSDSYSFLDVAVLDEVRQRFATGDAIAILSADLEQVIWANGPGAAVFGYPDIEAVIGASARLPLIARRQIMATSGFPEIGSNRALLIRLATGMTSRAVGFLASAVTMPDGEKAIMLTVPAGQTGSRSEAEIANRAIGGFTEDGHFVAFVDGRGGIEAASEGFSALGISRETLAALVADVANESDRIVKRLVPGGASSYPAGLARLTDDPARHLLVVVDEDRFGEALLAEPDAVETEGVGGDMVAPMAEPQARHEQAPPPVASGPAPPPAEPAALDASASVPETEDQIAPAGSPERREEAAGPVIGDAVTETSEAEAASSSDAQPRKAVADASEAEPPARHDQWYFNAGDDEQPARPDAPQSTEGPAGREISAEASDRDDATVPAELAIAPSIDRAAAPVRFVWRTDADGRFSALSSEFVETVGRAAADIIGRSFRDVASAFGLDPSGEIGGLLERRDTWSGRSVLWPVAGTDLKIPVDLAALPVYGRSRAFEGFRGFGVARTGDAVVDPEAIGMALAPNDNLPEAATTAEQPAPEAPKAADPFKGEVPALTIVPKPERRFADKVIRLAEHRQPANDKGLSTLERSAFREIGERLKKDSTPEITPPALDEPAQANHPEGSPSEAEARPAEDNVSTLEPAAGTERLPEADAEGPATGLEPAATLPAPDAEQPADAEQTAQDTAPDNTAQDNHAPEPVDAGEGPEDGGATAHPPTVLAPANEPGKVSSLRSLLDYADRGNETAEEASAEPAAVAGDGQTSSGPMEQPAKPESADDAGPGAPPAWKDASPAEEEVLDDSAALADIRDAEDEGDLARLDGEQPADRPPLTAAAGPATSSWPGSLLDYAQRDGQPAYVADNSDEMPVAEPRTLPASEATETAGAEEALARTDTEDRPAAAEAPSDEDELAAEDSMAAADFRDARDDGDLVRPVDESVPTPQAAEAASESAEVRPDAPAERRPLRVPPLKTEGFLPSAFSSGNVDRDAPDMSILGKLPVPLLIHSGDVLHYANEEFLDLTGYGSLDDLESAGGLGVLFADPYADDSASDGTGRALRLRTRSGQEFPIEAILRSVPWRGGKALMLVVRRSGEEDETALAPQAIAGEQAQPDISELKARIAEMRTIIDTATDGVVLIGRDGTIRSISRPAEALFGFDSDEVTGKPFASLFAIESQRAARDYLTGLSEPGVASVLNDGREVIGREAQGRFIPLFMTIGRLPNDSGFCAVVRDITQWKRAEEDLTQARAVAERASSQKTDFLARISHEIRTPLNAIIGFSELMVDEKFGPVANDRYRDYLRDINRSGNHVLDLVNDLLDISKIEAGQQEMDYEAVSLNDTLAETVAMMQPQANRERVIIRSSFASRLPDVVADLRSVRQIALNILSNAIRYTQAGGQVIVSTAYEPSGDVVMRVRDTGIGMTQAEIEQALKPFKQISALRRGRGDGTGLGLPLTKAMVEANRARFTINSTPGEGTLVEIAFPSTRVLAE